MTLLMKEIVQGLPKDWRLVKEFNDDMSEVDLAQLFGGIISTKDKTPSKKRPTLQSEYCNIQKLSRRKRRTKEFSILQKLFRQSYKKTYEAIFKKSASQEKVTLANIEEVFTPIFSSTSEKPKIPLPVESTNTRTIEPITRQEIKSALKATPKSSAPGIDGWSKDDVQKIPVAVLKVLFNNWIFFGVLPKGLKKMRTIFIPKVNQPKDGGDYRPITLASMIYRIFMRILNARLQGMLPLNRWQMGFCKDKATTNNLLLIQGVMRRQRRKNKNLLMCSIDISKAFDSVSHESILNALQHRGCPDMLLKTIANSYEGSTTVFEHNGEKSCKPVSMSRGIKQGDPTSPLLFNLTMDALIEKLSNIPGLKVSRTGGNLSVVAYADDIILIADNYASLNLLIKTTEEFLEAHHLKINAKKCEFVGWLFQGQRKTCKYSIPPIKIGGSQVGNIKPDTPFRYLGLDLFCNKTPRFPLNELKREIAVIRKAQLRPRQKLIIIKDVILPKFLYPLAAMLSPGNCAQKADAVMRKAVKELFQLPLGFPNVLLRLPWRKGGLALPNLEEISQKIFCGAIGKLVRMNDPVVEVILEDPPTKRIIQRTFSKIGAQYVVSDKKELDSIYKRSKERQQKVALSRLKCKDTTTFSTATTGNKWLDPNSNIIGSRDFNKALRLRSGLMKTRALSNKKSSNPQDRICRKCGASEETSFHIMQECLTVKNERIKRHNVVARNVSKFLTKIIPGSVTITEPLKVTSAGKRLKPDLIIKSPSEDIIIEVAIPWDSSQEYLTKVFNLKKKKYQVLSDELSKCKSTRIIPVVIGARGIPATETIGKLRKLGVKQSQLEFLCVDSIIGSLCMYTSFMA